MSAVGATVAAPHNAADMTNSPQLLRIRDVAEQLNVSVRGVEALIYTGALRSVVVGSRSRRVLARDLQEFIDSLGGSRPEK